MAEEDKLEEETIEIHTLLGRGSQFEGKLTFEGTVRIDGELRGEVFTDDILVVGEGGYVNADLEIGSLVVEGTVEGNIVAKQSVEIHAPGRVKGNITTPSLFIDRGVVFEGSCNMSEPVDEGSITAEPPESQQKMAETDRGMGNVSKAGTIDD